MVLEDPSAQPLVVLGMHRSGTSLAASLLQSAGVHVGERLIKGNWSNARGHFEDLDFVDFHRKVLVELGLHRDGWLASDVGAVPESWFEQARAIAERKNRPGRPWGWKDPRTVLFLDQWVACVPGATYLAVYRAPWEVIDSLYRRGDPVFEEDPEIAMRCWLFYNERLLEHVQRAPAKVVCANVSAIAGSPAQWVEEVVARSGISLSAPDEGCTDASLLHGELARERARIVYDFYPEAISLYRTLEEHSWCPAGLSHEQYEPPPNNESERRATAMRDWQAAGALAFERNPLRAAEKR